MLLYEEQFQTTNKSFWMKCLWSHWSLNQYQQQYSRTMETKMKMDFFLACLLSFSFPAPVLCLAPSIPAVQLVSWHFMVSLSILFLVIVRDSPVGVLLCYSTQVQDWGNKMFLGQRRWKGQSSPRSAWEVQWESQGWQGHSWRWVLWEHQWGLGWPGLMAWNGVLGYGQRGGRHWGTMSSKDMLLLSRFWEVITLPFKFPFPDIFTRYNSNDLNFFISPRASNHAGAPLLPNYFQIFQLLVFSSKSRAPLPLRLL